MGLLGYSDNLMTFNGLLGWGKTISMVAYTLDQYRQQKDLGNNYKVYANFDCTFAEKINPLRLMDFKLRYCYIMLTELDTIIDCRNPMSPSNILLGYFFKETRKFHVKVIGDMQLLDTADYRFVDLTNMNVLCLREGEERDPKRIWNNPHVHGVDLKTWYYLDRPELEYYFEQYDTDEAIIPLVLDETLLDFKEILKMYKDVNATKEPFVDLISALYPQLKRHRIQSCFTLIGLGRFDLARKVIIGRSINYGQEEKIVEKAGLESLVNLSKNGVS